MSATVPARRTPAPRRPGRTTRFQPYYKVQVFQPGMSVWKPVNGMHATEAAAWAACPEGKVCRLMHFTPGSQTVITR